MLVTVELMFCLWSRCFVLVSPQETLKVNKRGGGTARLNWDEMWQQRSVRLSNVALPLVSRVKPSSRDGYAQLPLLQ